MKRAGSWLLLCLALAGCAGYGPDGPQPRSGTRLAGLTENRLLQCAGPPRHRQERDGRAIWTYETGEQPGGRRVFGDGGDDGGLGGVPTAERYCVARVHLENGRVTRTEYSGFTGGLFTRGDQCARLFAGCGGD